LCRGEWFGSCLKIRAQVGSNGAVFASV
jgi:hypothetical protein